MSVKNEPLITDTNRRPWDPTGHALHPYGCPTGFMRQLTKLALLGGGALLAAWTAWGVYATRSADPVPYQHLGTVDGIERRGYAESVLVETTASNERTAFRRLFQYISGANEVSDAISMTAPVVTRDGESIQMTAPVRSGSSEDTDNEVRMAFYLPPTYDAESAPEPTDDAVALVVEPPKTLAVKRFSWYAPSWRVARQERQLLSRIDDQGLEQRGEPTLLRYNDPLTPPFMRRNEVAVEVEEAT